MRLSTLMHLHKIFKEFGISNKVKEEKVTLNYYNNSKASKGYGNLIHLGSVDDKEKIKCVKPETDVLTINGFKNIKKIKIGDKVASVNPKTLEMEYKDAKWFVILNRRLKELRYNDYSKFNTDAISIAQEILGDTFIDSLHMLREIVSDKGADDDN